MKKQEFTPFILLFAVFLCFCVGLFLGRNLYLSAPVPIHPVAQAVSANQALDLNRAERAQLMTLPGIGPTLANRILSYRDANGSFSSVAELLNIEGIGEERLEALLPYITAGG